MIRTQQVARKVLPAELLPLSEDFDSAANAVSPAPLRTAQVLALPIPEHLKSSVIESVEQLPLPRERYIRKHGESRDWSKTLYEALVRPCFLGLLVMVAMYASVREVVSAFRSE